VLFVFNDRTRVADAILADESGCCAPEKEWRETPGRAPLVCMELGSDVEAEPAAARR
jgi:hypothetical protein